MACLVVGSVIPTMPAFDREEENKDEIEKENFVALLLGGGKVTGRRSGGPPEKCEREYTQSNEASFLIY